MKDVPMIFGSMVFGDSVMKARLPQDTYRSLKQTIASGKPLNMAIANAVAAAMKDWAVENGATHFTHWFQPMTGVTAGKHDSFISPSDGGVIMEFSGKELIRGESDASSFPSGGLRATFEARGYTAWDPTSYAFIMDSTLYVPTAFCSYSGEALDQKTPLLRSMDAINTQVLRVLRLLGDRDTRRVSTTVGPEQEYFLVDKSVFERRPDLMLCGRTLFGARPPKAQELDDHYYGAINPRVHTFMRELDDELWKLGVLAKTEHNEAAPAQHELAPIYTTTNIAADHNQITMELLKRIAAKHGMACLLHEKPFAGVSGSGKHNNWSISTDAGVNLLDPGDSPADNERFLIFLLAMVKGADEHQDLLRFSVVSPGNDHRLGASEAPPAIVSMFLGDDITGVLEDIEAGADHKQARRSSMSTGAAVLPSLQKDTTDRNRTSPLAFTGNKFEFRMLGAPTSISSANIVLNLIMADSLCQFADRLEKAADISAELNLLARETITAHKRIIFNGNNYTNEWREEAKARGLLDLATTVDALARFNSPENIALFEKFGVMSAAEVNSRAEIMADNYCSTIRIEALTMTDMLRRDIIPAVLAYQQELVTLVASKRALALPGVDASREAKLLTDISCGCDALCDSLNAMESIIADMSACCASAFDRAAYCRDRVLPIMKECRAHADALEMHVAAKCWPYPTYAEMLGSVR